ncbi:hypothetical protein [Streptomyces sp. ISL-100]|uniref:hypothetical protein n=1 Tax=Streptomyces sp. ISL-100 TaxID=2819173 RepID=UPI001BEBAE78|nr:hypothetical protein [Streptomyces sp. ISL-100]MBT2396537.1 hypothetical protein [Streptomyces sp. ISL-100]
MVNYEWDAVKQEFPFGAEVAGAVERVASFGIFISIEGVRRYGAVADVAGMHKRDDDDSVLIWPEVGESITGVVVDHSEHNQQLKLHLT